MNGHQPVVVRAGGERDLELARQLLADGVTEEESRCRFRVRRDVEDRVRAEPRHLIGGDVADGVAASLARCQPYLSQLAQHGGRIGQLDVVELDRLARGDVADFARRVPVRDVANDVELLGRHGAMGDLDADHLGVVLPLAVDTVLETEGPEVVA